MGPALPERSQSSSSHRSPRFRGTAIPRSYLTFQSLSPPRRRLVSLMNAMQFGRIEGLIVVGGEPVFDPPPKTILEIKFCSENGLRRDLDCADYRLRPQVQELMQQLDRLGDGHVLCLLVRHGVPFSMNVDLPDASERKEPQP